jgi:hypothetical protein
VRPQNFMNRVIRNLPQGSFHYLLSILDGFALGLAPNTLP